jgi:ppGpp synthetase/RelA/SpoT-type nucleotidyltranferase
MNFEEQLREMKLPSVKVVAKTWGHGAMVEFDFDVYAAEKATEYASHYQVYRDFAAEVQRIVTNNLLYKEIKVQVVQARAKEVASFQEKCKKRAHKGDGEDDTNRPCFHPKYSDPLQQITDLAGIRIIAFSLRDVELIRKIILELFEHQEDTDKGLERVKNNDFGYKSIHILAKISQNRLSSSPELSRFQGLVCEIQIRTILQHAWAEIEHSIRYKTKDKIDLTMKESLVSVAGLLHIGDKELQAINDSKSHVLEAMAASLNEQVIASNPADINTGSKLSKIDRANLAQTGVKVKELVLAGRYDEAIAAYSQQIDFQPESHTLYLGRAKAKYLNGDSEGALADIQKLNRMEILSPKIVNDISNVVDLITGRYSDQFQWTSRNRPSLRVEVENEGVALGRAVAYAYDEHVDKGKKHLFNGEGEAAFNEFSLAEELGYNWAFAALNKSISCLMANDLDGSKYFLGLLSEKPDTPMQITLVATNIIISMIESYKENEGVHPDKVNQIQFEIERLRGLLVRFAAYHQNPYELRVQPLSAYFRNIERSQLSDATKLKLNDLRALLEEPRFDPELAEKQPFSV